MIVNACPRCDSINVVGKESGPGFKAYGCTWCGLLFYGSESKHRLFDGEKKKRVKKDPDPWMFPELEAHRG